jgi:hypothetical protein
MHIYDTRPAIVGVTESWGRDEILDAELSVAGYELYRRDRSHRSGGGTLLYVSKSLQSAEASSDTYCNYDEAVASVISFSPDRKVLVLCAYRPPAINREDDLTLQNMIRSVPRDDYADVILMGDFNLPCIDWTDMSWASAADPFMDSILDSDLCQHVQVPTRGNNTLDLVFTCDDSAVRSVQVDTPLGKSDHMTVCFEYNTRSDLIAPALARRRCFARADFRRMNDLLARELPAIIESTREASVDEVWAQMEQAIESAIDQFVPLQTLSLRRKPIWADGPTWRALRAQKNAFRRYRRTRSGPAYDRYVTATDVAITMSRESVVRFQRLVARNIKSDCKSFWKYTNSNRISRKSPGPIRDPETDQLSTNDQECAEFFNKFFGSVFQVEPATDPPDPARRTTAQLSDIVIDTALVRKHLAALDPSSAPGADGIPNRLLRECKDSLAAPLAYLFRKSIESGMVPAAWKSAMVTPVHKSGAKSDPGNYRGISLLSAVGKLLERCIAEQLIAYIEENQLLKKNQHGFRAKKSCETQLIEFLNFVTECVNNGDAVDVIYADMRKAFDVVPHKRLIRKCELSFGLSGRLLAWIKNYLSDRFQSVSINGVASPLLEITSGVPQGGVIPPLLFLMFVDDMDDDVSASSYKFADDAKFCRRLHREMHEFDMWDLQHDLSALSQWGKMWLMQFNVKKFSSLHFGFWNPAQTYRINKEYIPHTASSQRDLGVIISDDLKSTAQCQKAANKAQQMIGLIRRTFRSLDKESFLCLYRSLIRPHLEFASCAWSPHLQRDIDLLEKTQARATKLVSAIRDLPYRERLEWLGLQTLQTRRYRSDLILMYKLIHGLAGMEFDHFFEFVSDGRTRGHMLKVRPRCHPRLECRKHFWANRVTEGWNNLPTELVTAPSLTTFKALMHEQGVLPSL